MTEPLRESMDAFERRLAGRLVTASSVALRSVDPLAVARQAAQSQRAAVLPGIAWRGSPRSPWASLVILATLILVGLLAVSLAIGGSSQRLPALPPPSLQASPSTLPQPSASSALWHGQLAYSLTDGRLYLAGADATNPVLIAQNGDNPVWYDDVLTYTDWSGSTTELIARQADGTLRTIGTVGSAGQPLTWWRVSPDGKQFAVVTAERLTIVAPDGSRRDLPRPAGFEAWDTSDLSSLSWMPDKSAVLVGVCQFLATCQRGSADQHGLFLVPLRGGLAVPMSTADAPAFGAVLSPDGRHVAFQACGPFCYGLGVMRSDGTNRWIVVFPAAGHMYTGWSYAWSADSGQLAFTYGDANDTDGQGNQGVWVVPADGNSQPRQVAPGQPGGYHVEGWSADGHFILAESSEHIPTMALESIPVDGTSPTVLVPDAYNAAWQWPPNP